MKAEVFVALNQLVCEDYYGIEDPEQPVEYWYGHRLLGIDGSLVNLPDTMELRRAFSVQHNQHSDYPLAQMMVIHDLLNDIGLAATLQSVKSEHERVLDDDLWTATKPGDVMVMDRGMVGYLVIAKAVKTGRNVVIRCPNSGFSIVKRFFKSAERELITTLRVPPLAEVRAYVRSHDLPDHVRIRLVKCELANGVTEVLLTTLCDQDAIPREAVIEAYGVRYAGQEGFFNRLKNILELERFSGRSEAVIRQDFCGMIFLATLESVLAKPAQMALAIRDMEPEAKTHPQVNRVTSYTALVQRVVGLLADPTLDEDSTLDRITDLLLKTPTYHAPDRNYPRPAPNPSRAEAFLRYRKRLTG